MRKIASILLLLPFFVNAQSHEENIKRIFDESLTNSPIYENLRVLCKDIGSRLSGSPEAAAAVEYTRQLMESYGFDTVYLQPVMVPHWIRSETETARVVNSEKYGSFDMTCTSLGNSIGTGAGGILAEVIEVSGIKEANELGKKLEGKVVFYNGMMDPTLINNFAAYGGAVGQRGSGASVAAKFGAKAVLVRSMTNRHDNIPHTGALNYNPNHPKIPAMAISTNDADRLSALLKEQSNLKIYMESYCKLLEDVLSYNVIGEIKGKDTPEEIIAVGGHLDSWDAGDGAHDDGGGCLQAIEALRIFKAFGWQPKRTIRAVMWMNEENGLRGGREYARMAKEKNEKHIAAIESDAGSFRPLGFRSTGSEKHQNKLKSWKKYFLPYGVWSFDEPGGGADIRPLKDQGTFLIGLKPSNQRYFIYHHTPADVFEAVDKRELEMCAASMASLVYLIDQEGLE